MIYPRYEFFLIESKSVSRMKGRCVGCGEEGTESTVGRSRQVGRKKEV